MSVKINGVKMVPVSSPEIQKVLQEQFGLAEKVDALAQVLMKLSLSDREFAASLIASYTKWGKLTDKQLHWVGVLTQRGQQPQEAPPKEAAKTDVGNMAGVYKLFATAQQHLKYPKINFEIDGLKVTLALQTKGKWAGYINITDGKPFDESTWYGRVDSKGAWTQTRSEDPKVQEDMKLIETFLREFAANPSAVAQAHGEYAHFCCFCKSDLTDEKSKKAGYGPVCAKNWGLPWGK